MALRRKIPARIRAAMALRARNRCEYCQCPDTYAIDGFTIDHTVPVALEGGDSYDDLALACFTCNNLKQAAISGVNPETGVPVPLYNPRRDVWEDHFRWSNDFLTIISLTATGRVTLTRLQMNRKGVVNLRRALIALGDEHPPKKELP